MDTNALYLDPTKINHVSTDANSATYPFMDFEFEEGDLRTVAILTMNVSDGSWHALIRTAEDEEADFGDGETASPEQLEALKSRLPENVNELVADFKAANAAPSGPRF